MRRLRLTESENVLMLANRSRVARTLIASLGPCVSTARPTNKAIAVLVKGE